MAEAEAWVLIPKLDKDKTGCVLDMRPLVLCKNCKYWKDGYLNYDVHPWVPCMELETKPEWFCAYGERR